MKILGFKPKKDPGSAKTVKIVMEFQKSESNFINYQLNSWSYEAQASSGAIKK